MPPFASLNRSPIRRPLAGAVRGIGASQTAIVDIPVGATYLALRLFCTIAGVAATRAQLEAMLTSFRLTVSGVEMWTLTGTQLIAIMEFYSTGVIADTGVLTINFQRLWMRESAGALNPAYGTLNESSFQLEITQAAGSTIDSMLVSADIDPVAQPLGAHMIMPRITPSIGATGLTFVPQIRKTPGDFLYALHIGVPVAANLTVLSYVADSVRVVDQITQALLNATYRACQPVRTMQTSKLLISLDFTCRGFDGDAIPQDMSEQILELTFANAAPGQVDVIAEIGTTRPTSG